VSIHLWENLFPTLTVSICFHLWFNYCMGTLYLVATPIGNLEDMSPRALRILREARLIAAEDTRVTRTLLTHFDLHTPLTSYFEHNKLTKLEAILTALAGGDVALVSDAGTPAINDPGYELVRAALEAGHIVCPIPGPSAPLAALAASGLPTDSFLYLGYLPRKSAERRELFKELENLSHTLIFLESPHRLLVALQDLESCFGNRRIAVARELTKVHEQIWRGTIPQALSYFMENDPRGEFTLVVAGKVKGSVEKWSEDKVNNAIRLGLKLGESPSVLAKQVARESGWDRKEIYNLITARQE
jgi:16S rRNA (cytidine1402-2'-O)-methyltransferase